MTAQKTEQLLHDPILNDMVSRIVSVYDPLRVYLFGSRARGTANQSSDYDILIVVKEKTARELKTAGPAYKALWGLPAAIDVLVWTELDFEMRLHLPNSFPSEVTLEGVLLHVA